MTRIGTTLLVLAMATMGRAEGPKTPEVVRGNNRFALDLHSRLREKPGNLFYSPASISTALAMTYAGARGETAEQMAATLHFDVPGERLHAAFASLGKALNAGDSGRGYRLTMANRLWGQAGYHFLPEFLAVTSQSYGAELAQVDFAQAEQARQRINEWIEQQTQGRIRDLIPSGVLDRATRLVLTNAVYFKGVWAAPFRKEATEDGSFHVAAGKTVRVPLMYRQDDLRYWAGDGLKTLELPYGKGDLAMVVLLPDRNDGLPGLEAKLTEPNLGKWLSGLRSQEVKVHLPRFRMESQFRLAEALKAMGMTRAFDPDRADFSGMSTQEELYVSAVIHKAFVDVNEEGTEAAAATAVALAPTAAPIEAEPAVFRADHPFLFLIRDNRSGSILFIGRLTDPKG